MSSSYDKGLRNLTLGGILQTNVEHSIVQSASHQEFETEIIHTLRVAVGVTLLSAIPVKDQSITESQAGSRVGSVLVAIVQASSKSGFDMADNLFLEAILVLEAGGLVSLPSLTLGFGDRSWWLRR